MKSLFLVFSFVCFCSACAIPCPKEAVADTYRRMEENTLKNNYKNIDSALKDIKREYEKLLDELKESNKKLDVAIKLSKEKLLREKEIAFLLKKYNELQSLNNDIRASGGL